MFLHVRSPTKIKSRDDGSSKLRCRAYHRQDSPILAQTSGIKTSSTTRSCPSLESELRDVVGFLKSLRNYEKSGVLKGAAIDFGDAFISNEMNFIFAMF
ncbi:hypothetical protein YC2023_023713 [Brassica napus]